MGRQIRAGGLQGLAASVLVLLAPGVSATSSTPQNSLPPGSLQNSDETPPEQQVARIIELICPDISMSTPSADLAVQCTAIATNLLTPNADAQGAIDGLGGMAAEEDSAVHGTTVDAHAGTKSAVEGRIAAVRGSLASLHGSTFTLNGRTVDARTLLGGDGVAAGEGARGWSVFVDGGYAHADKDATPNESGYGLNDWRVTAGADYQAGGEWLVGGALHYASSDADLDANGGDLSLDAWGASLYASYYPSPAAFVDVIVSYYRNDYDQNRNVSYAITGAINPTTVNQTAVSSFSANDISATVTAGYQFTSGSWSYGPYGRLTYARVDTDSFTEQMSNPGAPGSGLATHLDSQGTTSLPLSIGLQASRSVAMSWGTLVPQAFVEYVHEFDNDNDPITGFFVDDPFQERFALPTDSPDRNYAVFGASIAAQFAENATARLTYQGLAGYKNLTVNSVVLGLRIEW